VLKLSDKLKTEPDIVDRLIDLLERGEISRMYRFAYDHTNDPLAKDNPDFYLYYGLAAKLLNHSKSEIDSIKKLMANSTGYTRWYFVDWQRDDAKKSLRKGKPIAAEKIMDEVEKVDSNINRIAADFSTRGQIADFKKGYKEAIKLYLKAAEIWNNNPLVANEQWIADNKFHLFRAMVANGVNHHDRFTLAREIIGGEYLNADSGKKVKKIGDKSRTRRWRARIINLGRFGLLLDNLMIRFWFLFI
jgi:tetratricopeptide (TPR) repeat protein